jgi:cell division protein FtsQ
MWNNYQMLSLFANLLFVMVALAIIYTINSRYIKLPVFPLKEISVNGIDSRSSGDGRLHKVTRQQIEQIVRNEIAGNFFTVNLSAVRQALSELPWVRTAQIYRDWPDGLNVLLEEHKVLAHWGNSALVNTYGEIFRAAAAEELPLFVGPMEESSREMAQRYVNFRKILEPLKQRIVEINLSPRYAWCIRLDVGTVIELGRGQAETALARYSSVYDQTIARLNQQIQPDYMDLRYPNGFAVRIPETTQQESVKQAGRKNEDVKPGRCN